MHYHLPHKTLKNLPVYQINFLQLYLLLILKQRENQQRQMPLRRTGHKGSFSAHRGAWKKQVGVIGISNEAKEAKIFSVVLISHPSAER